MHGLYVASDEDDADYPNFLRKAEKRLAKAQRKLSKRQKGSHNREKQRLRVAVLHEKIANQRRDFLHKKARYLVDRYDAIGIEDISVKAMAKHKKGGKFSFGGSVADNGWNMFTNILEYKLAWQGKKLVKIDKWYPSSQLCHVCGYQNDETKDLSVREWDCPNCGNHHNRDKNAAINIRRGSHGNLRLWRECKSSQLFGVRGAVLVETGSSRLYRREYVHFNSADPFNTIRTLISIATSVLRTAGSIAIRFQQTHEEDILVLHVHLRPRFAASGGRDLKLHVPTCTIKHLRYQKLGFRGKDRRTPPLCYENKKTAPGRAKCRFLKVSTTLLPLDGPGEVQYT